MGTDAEKIPINGASSQYDRWLRALDANYAKVDGRTFPELLNFAVKFGGLINFYNIRNERDGDWVLFFLTDPTMLLASIEATDISEIQYEFARLERQTLEARQFEIKFKLLRDTFELILGLARKINYWLESLDLSSESETMRLLRMSLLSMIERDLSQQLRMLKAYAEGAGLPAALDRPIILDYSGFLPIWDLSDVCPDGSIYRGRTNNQKINHALPHLNPIFSSFLYAISDLKPLAVANFPATLEEGNHKPNIALYIAFAKLFQTAQDTINTFSSRYTRFYYRDILREKNRGPIADKVYLTFTLAEDENVVSTTVPRGTIFVAGQDEDGRDILYASDKSLLVTAASIAKLRTLRVVSGPLLKESNAALEGSDEPTSPTCDDASLQVVRQVLSSEIFVAEEEAEAAGAVTEGQSAWATFGNTEVKPSNVEVTELATLGFAIASSYLLLTGGTRMVTLDVYYLKNERLDCLLEEISKATGLDADEILTLVLNEAFSLYISTSAGWLKIETYEAASQSTLNDPTFSIDFELPSTVPPVVAYNPESEEEAPETAAELVTNDPSINASNPDPSLPTLKAYLDQEPVKVSGPSGTVYIYPISLLEKIEVTAIQIYAAVFDLADLQLENTDGEIDASTPFAVFGGLPVVGSYLVIRHAELFVKLLDNLQISITWFNLPQNEDGFKGYYKYYTIGLDGHRNLYLFDNQVFYGGISIRNPGLWCLSDPNGSPPCPEVGVYLFRTQPECGNSSPIPVGPLCPVTDFDSLTVYRSDTPPYYDAAKSAIKLELTGPPYAFGNDLYAQNVLNAVIKDLPDTERCEDKCLKQCGVLSKAAQCIEACLICLANCRDTSGSVDPECVDACLDTCLKSLAKLLVRCIEQCLEESVCLPSEKILRRVKECLNSCINVAEPGRAQCIQQCLDEFWELLCGSPPDSCFEKCCKLYDAIQCVLACAEQGGSLESLELCLTDCKEELDETYAVCLKVCMEECMSLKKELKYPNEPYLPQATKVSVNYSARCTILGAGESCGLFFHLLPFGGYRQFDPSLEELPPLLPRFSYPGNLYIGFSRMIPPQTLTLLFQMASESAGYRPVDLPPVLWEYLSSNLWKCLQTSSIQSDSTNGLQNSGTITLSIPAYDPANNTVLSSEYQWLRASVTDEPDLFPKTVSILPHALLTTWVDNENTGEHLRQPLPPHTINSSVQDIPDIGTIDQPMESFGGRAPETDRTFEIRVGERLRHKDRAILNWDYERLVLERFPTVWKVQALAARNLQKGRVPGSVLVVIVPGTDSIEVVDPTAPKAATDLLNQIQSYLKGLVGPFVQLYVVNPIYVRIKVITTVKFWDEEDPGASIKRLNDELVQYLSPWFYDAARAAKGSRYVSEADISEFIQTRPYVESMIKLELKPDPEPEDLDSDWFFLTSAQQHDVSIANDVECEDQTGY